MKNTSKVKTLDARHYIFTELDARSLGTFGLLGYLKNREAVSDVSFSHLDDAFSYYGNGTCVESAAMILSDGNIIFCQISGCQFIGTFDSSANISMKYYEVTKRTGN
jgi:hypothetical protein